MSETTELAVVNAQNAVQIFTGGGLNAILDGIETNVRAMELDGSTYAGRDEIRSVAYKVTRTKTALDAEAKKLTEGWRTATSQVNAERKRAQERLDALAEEVRRPLTEFENKEKNRIAAHEAAFADLAGMILMLQAYPNMEVTLLEDHARDFDGLHAGRDWEEFKFRAKKVREETTEYLSHRITARKQFDADQAELARLRAEEAERLVREREQKAAEAARLEAERRAKEAADAEARRVIEAANKEAARVAAEALRVKQENERREKKAEADRKAEQYAREQAERRAMDAEGARVEALRKAEADKMAAEAKAAADLKAAQDKAEKDREAAIAKERARVEAQRKAEADAQAKREANAKLRAKIRSEISEDVQEITGTFLNLEPIVEAIMDGKVRHVRVIF